MFSIFGSLFGKLFSADKNVKGGVLVDGKKNVSQIIVVQGDHNKIDFSKFGKKIKNVEPTKIVESNNEKFLQELKKDILTNSDKMSIISLIHKATAIASIKGDEKTLTWLQNELYGYPQDPDKIPDYRKAIDVRLDIGINFAGRPDMWDLRDYPIPITWGSGLASLEEVFNSNQRYKISFVAPMMPEMKKLLMSFKPPISNFDFNRTPFIISKSQIESVASKVKSKILIYVSRI
jgi:hypothetical protein